MIARLTKQLFQGAHLLPHGRQIGRFGQSVCMVDQPRQQRTERDVLRFTQDIMLVDDELPVALLNTVSCELHP